MEFNRETTSTAKPPLFDGTNYACWKVRMIAFLRAIDDEARNMVEEGYIRPIVVAARQTILKSIAQWTKEEKRASNLQQQEN